MKTLNLQSLKISKSTVTLITEFVYNNRTELSNELKMFYNDAKGLIEIQLRKPKTQRMSMLECLERAYNIDSYILKSGAASVETQFLPI